MTSIKALAALMSVTAALTLTNCNSTNGNATSDQSAVDSLRDQLMTLVKGDSTISAELVRFDTLDYTVFSNQQWDRLKETHANDIKVYWPDGHVAVGLDKHIEDMKAMFVYAPDTRIKQHPIRFGSGKYTGVIGIMQGTFTKPMPLGNGKFLQPTGKAFTLQMATIGVWGPDGTMSEEHLFWDNKSYLDQLGVGK